MKLICKLRGHLPGPETWNEGLYFAACTRCGGDIIRQRGGEWGLIPTGLRVAWHPIGHQGLHWSKAISRARESHAAPPKSKPLPTARSGEA